MWLADNIIMVSAIFLGVAVLVGLAALAITGLRLWFAFKRAKAQIDERVEALTASLETTERLQAALPERQMALEGALADLQVQANTVSILASQAGEAVSILRAPLDYLRR